MDDISKLKKFLDGFNLTSPPTSIISTYSQLNDAHTRLREPATFGLVPDTAFDTPSPFLGTLGRLPQELRDSRYEDIAENSTMALNQNANLSRVTKGESKPPGLLLASKQLCGEFVGFYRKKAWPTILDSVQSTSFDV
jgi:hypothetical protein